MATEVKQFLDKAGVEALWEKIYNGFAPRWQSYKPSVLGSTAESNKLPAEFVELKSDKANVGKLHSDESRAALNATFVSAGPISDGAGNWYGRDLVVQIPEVKAPTSATAEDGGYGIMSPEDKWKLDHVGTTAEDAVTIKGVQVGGNDLTLKSKLVNWDLHYDTDTNALCIRDLNAADNKVVSSVSVDNLLSDAIVKGFLSGVELTDKNDKTGEVGLFLRFIFTTGIGSDPASTESEEIYVSVSDLVDVYTAGTGISIDQGAFNDAGGDERTSTITLKKATAGERGGIEVIDTAALGAGDSIRNEKVNGRNFGVAILDGDDDTAYVNVPVTGITIEESTVKDDSVAIATEDSFQVLAGYNKTADGVDGWKLTPTYKTISVNKETDVTIDGGTGSGTTTLTWEDRSFDILQTITTGGTNGHKITRTASTITLPEETTLSLSSTADATNTISIVSNVNTAKVNNIENVPVATYAGSFSTSAVTDANKHNIINTATTHSFEIQIPAIEESFINSLIYRVD